MKHLLLFLFLVHPFTTTQLYAQTTVGIRVCTYNVLNLGDNDYNRAEAFRTVLEGVRPDILVCQEVNNEIGVQMMLDSVLNYNREAEYRAVPFHNGPDTDNALLYNSQKLQFIEARYHPTALRDIAEYVLLPVGTEDTLVVFAFHLKAGEDSESKAQRLEEAKVARSFIEEISADREFIIAGDLNVYAASEPAYQWLTDPSRGTQRSAAVDPIDKEGDWHENEAFAAIHTQSTRGRQFGGGLEGSMDDRFDFLLLSHSLNENKYRAGSYTTYGNDGNHFDDSINVMPNTAVPHTVAQALHDASDHLPVYLDIQFTKETLSTEAAAPAGILLEKRMRLW